MPGMDPDEQARRFAAAALAADDPTGWFERLYSAADDGTAVVPWDRGEPHPLLVEWAQDRGLTGAGRRALVVGCGPGYDAEFVAGLGYDTVAFDVSATGVAAARRRFPDSAVDYRTANLLELPTNWVRAHDLVVEIMTVQALPVALHAEAIGQVGRTVAPGGTLIVIAVVGGSDGSVDGSVDGSIGGSVDGPPWPLTRAEVESFAADGLGSRRIEEIRDARSGVRRWRAEFAR